MDAILADPSYTEDQRAMIMQAHSNALAAAAASAAEQRAIAQSLATVIKPRKPDPYSGAIDAEECLNFIENQAEYYKAVRLNSEEWVRFTALHLTGAAKSWWRDSGLNDRTSWDAFKASFTAYFTPPDSANMARRALDKLSQNKLSVASYTEQFRRLLRLIPGMDPATALYVYLDGLEENTRREVRLRQPTTLDMAITQATIVHSILNPTKPVFDVAPQTSIPNPMAMEVDNLRVQLNALRQRLDNNNSHGYGQGHGSRPLNRLSDNERQRLYQRGACFRCRKDGHQARNCPSRNGRSFNHVSFNEGNNLNPESGNAPGSQV